MIVVLSMNTAIDRVVQIRRFVPGEVYRAERAGSFAGGKALNVARVLRQLDAPVRVVGTLGGGPEQFIREWCERRKVDARWVNITAESRTCMTVVDPESGRQTVVNEPGPSITPVEIERVRDEVERSVAAGDIMCISGSSPPGVPDTFYADLVCSMGVRGVRVLVDASGEPLRAALEARPWAAVPNVLECASALGGTADPEVLVAALRVQVGHAMVTLGARGLLYAHGDGAWRVTPPRIETMNAVGSGDALVAGFLAGTMRGLDGLQAVRLGTACGASNAARFEPGIGRIDEIERLSKAVRVHHFAASRAAPEA